MSNLVFPGTLANMPGLGWSVGKAPAFSTKKQISVGNIELAASFAPYPVWTWTLKYNVLRQGAPYAEFETLAGFYLARQGAFDSFLYDDPTDDGVTDQSFDVGDGIRTKFQLVRTLGGFTEPIYNVNAITNVKVGGTPTGAYTQSGGTITFSSPPAPGLGLTWTGSYYWRVRFTDDTANFDNFASTFWQLQQMSFKSVLGS